MGDHAEKVREDPEGVARSRCRSRRRSARRKIHTRRLSSRTPKAVVPGRRGQLHPAAGAARVRAPYAVRAREEVQLRIYRLGGTAIRERPGRRWAASSACTARAHPSDRIEKCRSSGTRLVTELTRTIWSSPPQTSSGALLPTRSIGSIVETGDRRPRPRRPAPARGPRLSAKLHAEMVVIGGHGAHAAPQGIIRHLLCSLPQKGKHVLAVECRPARRWQPARHLELLEAPTRRARARIFLAHRGPPRLEWRPSRRGSPTRRLERLRARGWNEHPSGGFTAFGNFTTRRSRGIIGRGPGRGMASAATTRVRGGVSVRRRSCRVGPNSTIFPRYMMATRSQKNFAVARSCVM